MFNLQAWSNEFFQQATQPMNKELTTIFLKMLEIEEDKGFETPQEIKNQFLYQMIEKRADYIGLKLSEAAKIFLMFMSRSPGTAVMYLYALRSRFNSVDTNILAESFPIGFLAEDDLQKMWDKQKRRDGEGLTDNYLDVYQFA